MIFEILNEMENLKYSVIIRTICSSKDKLKITLDSVLNQKILPYEIILVIPNEIDCDFNKYDKLIRIVKSKKGMISQRYYGIMECKSDYALVLDDDVQFDSNLVINLYSSIIETKSDVALPIIYDLTGKPIMFLDKHKNVKNGISKRLKSWLIGIRVEDYNSKNEFCLSISKTGGYEVNKSLDFNKCNLAQTGSGALFFGKYKVFIDSRLNDEFWLDDSGYAILEDQVFFYKIFLKGYKIVVDQNVKVIHLDGATSRVGLDNFKTIYFLEKNNMIFWYKFIYKECKNFKCKIHSVFRYSIRVLSISMIMTVLSIKKLKFRILFDLVKSYYFAFRYLNNNK